jgi:hypothetical protein
MVRGRWMFLKFRVYGMENVRTQGNLSPVPLFIPALLAPHAPASIKYLIFVTVWMKCVLPKGSCVEAWTLLVTLLRDD